MCVCRGTEQCGEWPERRKRGKIKAEWGKDGDRHSAGGTNINNADQRLDKSNSHVWSRSAADYWHQGESLLVYLPHIMAADILLSINKKSGTAFFWLFACCRCLSGSQWPFESVQNLVWKAGRRAQSWLVTGSLSIWEPSSHLSFKAWLLMGLQWEASNGICKEILHRNWCMESRETKILCYHCSEH